MKKPQNQIILETECITEKYRKNLEIFRKSIQDNDFGEYFIRLENALFQFTVLFYTHRTIWTQPKFWKEYADAEDFSSFSETAYKQMIYCTLVNCYLILYFYIEGALDFYLVKTEQKSQEKKWNFMSVFKMLPENIRKHELKNGLNILRYVRNSAHGDLGTFKFAYPDEIIKYKEKEYFFEKGKEVSVS